MQAGIHNQCVSWSQNTCFSVIGVRVCSCVCAIQVFGGDKAKLRKTDNLKNEVAGLEAAVQAAGQEYDRVKLRNTQVCLHTNPPTHVHL